MLDSRLNQMEHRNSLKWSFISFNGARIKVHILWKEIKMFKLKGQKIRLTCKQIRGTYTTAYSRGCFFSGRRHGVYQIQEKEFISICKQYLALRFPDSLEPWFYNSYLSSRICLSNERIFFNYCKMCSVRNVFLYQ